MELFEKPYQRKRSGVEQIIYKNISKFMIEIQWLMYIRAYEIFVELVYVGERKESQIEKGCHYRK